jgi:hypothetical protein
MKDLGMNLGLGKYLRWDFRVLASFSFNQIDDVVYPAVLKSELLLLISSIDD